MPITQGLAQALADYELGREPEVAIVLAAVRSQAQLLAARYPFSSAILEDLINEVVGLIERSKKPIATDALAAGFIASSLFRALLARSLSRYGLRREEDAEVVMEGIRLQARVLAARYPSARPHVDDLVAEAAVRLLRASRPFSSGSEAASFIYKVLYRSFIDTLRKEKRLVSLDDLSSARAPSTGDEDAAVSVWAELEVLTSMGFEVLSDAMREGSASSRNSETAATFPENAPPRRGPVSMREAMSDLLEGAEKELFVVILPSLNSEVHRRAFEELRDIAAGRTSLDAVIARELGRLPDGEEKKKLTDTRYQRHSRARKAVLDYIKKDDRNYPAAGSRYKALLILIEGYKYNRGRGVVPSAISPSRVPHTGGNNK
jgi:DNA-directed RNA polymerase specialized sigma24 family protein